MLRFTLAFVFAIVVGNAAESADRAVPYRGWHRVVVTLPAGLPRPHYNFRTTISGPYVQPVYVVERPVVVVAPVYVPTSPPWVEAPLPYGDRWVPYADRLPYACGVYGYC